MGQFNMRDRSAFDFSRVEYGEIAAVLCAAPDSDQRAPASLASAHEEWRPAAARSSDAQNRFP
jgi:hypothetical protein